MKYNTMTQEQQNKIDSLVKNPLAPKNYELNTKIVKSSGNVKILVFYPDTKMYYHGLINKEGQILASRFDNK